MSLLEQVLKPASIAIIGASNSPNKAGNVIIKNLQASEFKGPIMPVNPKYQSIAGILAYPNIQSLPIVPDLAILCTAGHRNLELMQLLGEFGVKAVVIIAPSHSNCETQIFQTDLLEITKRFEMKVIGPNSLGIILPWLNLNASIAPISARRGNIAFVSQSAAVCSTILDWAENRKIGFSVFMSLGESLNVDFPELLDYLCRDSKTDAIMLYVDHIHDARAFISAAKAAARTRRILILKSGRTLAGQQALPIHNHAELGLDAAYDAAIKRSGMLRVKTTQELFAAVETLSHSVKLRGERLVIISNGGGSAVMAVDALSEMGGKLVSLESDICQSLDEILPSAWSGANPIDILGDADVLRYQKVIDLLIEKDQADVVLIIHTPSVSSPNLESATQLSQYLQNHPKILKLNVLVNWQGEGKHATSARLAFARAGFPAFRTPESGVTAFMHLVQFNQNQKQLMETPVSIGQIKYDAEKASDYILQANALGHTQLGTHESRKFFAYYGIDVVPTWLANDAIEAVAIASQTGYPVALKLNSVDITHKSDVNGLILGIKNPETLSRDATSMLLNARERCPNARIQGMQVQKMLDVSGAVELRVCVRTDPVFGPIILLGQGGAGFNFHRDAEVAIPPLNTTLARYFITDALRKGKITNRQSHQTIPLDLLIKFFVTLSQVVIDHAEIQQLDIHPLIVQQNAITILDVQIDLMKQNEMAESRQLAILPYPKSLEERAHLKTGQPILLRPILPEDEPKHKEFMEQVSVEDLYKRFFSDVGELNHEALANLTQIDYAREMAFVAVTSRPDSDQDEIIGVVRLMADPERIEAEFAILVRSDLKGLGLGMILMNKAIAYARATEIKKLVGMTMPSNTSMIEMAKKLGFRISISFEDGEVDLLLIL